VDPVSVWNADGVGARQFCTYYLGGPPQRYPDRYRAVDSGTYVSPAAPPTLVIHGDRDRLVPPQGVRAFVDKARAAGVRVELVRVPYADHAFDGFASGSLGNQARLTVTARFLRD
jgi:triacylglycerol lipase